MPERTSSAPGPSSRALIGALLAGHADEPVELVVVVPWAVLVLAEDAVVHQFRAVVADEHDERVVPEAHVGQLVEQDANPLVDEGDVAVVQRLCALDFRLGFADVALTVLTDLRQDEVPGLRVFVVAVGEVLGRVPVLVRGEAVDPEEEGRAAVVVL